MIRIRDADPDDAGPLADIFFRAVREGAAPAYDLAQRHAWAPVRPDAVTWARRLEGLHTLVADEGGAAQGFIAVRPGDSYVDLLFVLPHLRGQGVAAALYAEVERRMRADGCDRLHTQASHLAKAFFIKHGWDVLRRNTVTRGGVVLTNWIMEKHLR